MSTTVTIYSAKEMSVTDLPGNYGNGEDNHMPIGYYGSTGWRYRGMIRFPLGTAYIPSGKKILSATLRLKTTGSTNHVAKGSSVRLTIGYLTSSFDPTIGDGEVWKSSGGTVGFQGSWGKIDMPGEGQHLDGTVYDYDITDVIYRIAPAYLYKANGVTPCEGRDNYGIEIRSYDESSSSRSTEFWSVRGGYQPRLIVVYDDVEADPGTPTTGAPTGDIQSDPSIFEVTHPSGSTATITQLDIGVLGGTYTDLLNGHTSAATPGTLESIDVSAEAISWPVNTTIIWRTRGQNASGNWGPYGYGSFLIEPVPTVTIAKPTAGNRAFIHNLADPNIWSGSEAKPRVTVSHAVTGDGDATDWEFKVNSGTVRAYSGTYVAGVSYDFDLVDTVARATNFTIEARCKVGGQWSSWASVTAQVNWAQAMYSTTTAAGAGDFSNQSSPLGGGANAHRALLYRSTGSVTGDWETSLSEVEFDTGLDVLVRLSASDSAAVPVQTDIALQWNEDGDPEPDQWECVNGAITQVSDLRRFGVHSMKVVPTAGTTIVRNTRDVVVTPGQTYTFSVFLNTRGITLDDDVRLAWQDDGGTTHELEGSQTTSYGDDSTSAEDGWLRLYGTLVPTTATIRPIVITDTTDTFRLDSFQLEEGDIATQWKPGGLGPAVVLDVGGIAIDAQAGGIFRARTTGGEIVTLGTNGLELDDEPLVRLSDLTLTQALPVQKKYEVVDSPATWTKPANLSHIIVECIGGGGAGGGTGATASNAGAAGGGGGGGGYARYTYTAAELPATCTATVGTGGTGASNADGGDGTPSTFEGTGITTLSAGKGSGGTRDASGTGNSWQSGGGTDASTGPTDAILAAGSPGQNGHRLSLSGVSAATGVMGSGHGGASASIGGSGRQNPSTGAGYAGNKYGGGGAGAVAHHSTSARAGGNGADGVVIVTEFFLPVLS